MTRVIVPLLLTIALGACSKKEEPVPEPAQPAAPATPSAAVSVAPPAPSAPAENADIPTEEDFEAEAERRITSQNLEAELDKLEKEIAE